jgi:hypothetical protein
MHAPELRIRAAALMVAGRSAAHIAAERGVGRSTVHDWRSTRAPTSLSSLCPRCWARCRVINFDPHRYAEILGLYLADGHILRVGRSFRLRLSLDARYPVIVEESCRLLQAVFPENRVGETRRDAGHTRIVSVDHQHLPCLLPQHGAGKKHARAVRLEPWQREAVTAAPWRFLRGCIRSDGCVFVNRTGRYEYLSYDFSNRSADILDLFVEACDAVGVQCRRYERHIRIYRRPSVAAMVEHVGLKA